MLPSQRTPRTIAALCTVYEAVMAFAAVSTSSTVPACVASATNGMDIAAELFPPVS